MSAVIEERRWAPTSPIARVGAAEGRLLAGPPAQAGAESWLSHRGRLGSLPIERSEAAELRQLIQASGLTGRGGGNFPLAGKLETAATSGGRPLVVVNCSESEPASRKDRVLLEHRPHLVLDGAQAVATAICADEVVVYLHASRRRSFHAVAAAVAERAGRPPRISLFDAPTGYLAGESSVVVAAIAGAAPLPHRAGQPAAARGVDGRPTVVSNTETFAHVGLITRFGPEWFRQVGPAQLPGSTLVTVHTGSPGRWMVLELLGAVPMHQLMSVAGAGPDARAVLVGGYAGTWVDGTTAMTIIVDRQSLAAAGAPLGCGLLAVLPSSRCGLAETVRLLDYLAGQSAGQCGPCIFGLPTAAERLARIAGGGGSAYALRSLTRLLATIRGRGACGHPDGVLTLVESALDVFGPEIRAHRAVGHCRGRWCEGGLFPVPGAT